MARILIVEDEMNVASVLQDYLRLAGFETEHVRDGQAALRRMLTATPDLSLLDVMLPRLDGLAVLRRAKARASHPIIMLTARCDEADRLIGLALGADDYICKPFSPREVVARVRTVLRRTVSIGMSAAIERSGLELDETKWLGTLNGVKLHLTRCEFRLLQALAESPGHIFSRSKLLDLAYDDVIDVTERAVDSHIKNLRRKLALAAPDHEWIRSIYGVGFSFEAASGKRVVRTRRAAHPS
jgi:two-component system, OmpR family, response regulator BaeR